MTGNKAVLLSVKPKWCELIASGKKTVEVRKTRPKSETPFKCYIYCVKDRHGWFDFLKKERLDGKVIGEFVCDLITGHKANNQITPIEIVKYANGKMIYYWHISDLKIYDKPKELSEFKKYNRQCELFEKYPLRCFNCKICNLTRPPQSWCYVEELK